MIPDYTVRDPETGLVIVEHKTIISLTEHRDERPEDFQAACYRDLKEVRYSVSGGLYGSEVKLRAMANGSLSANGGTMFNEFEKAKKEYYKRQRKCGFSDEEIHEKLKELQGQ